MLKWFRTPWAGTQRDADLIYNRIVDFLRMVSISA